MFFSKNCIGCGVCGTICPNGAHTPFKGHTFDREKCTACGRCAAYCPTKALEFCGRETSIEEILAAVERDRAFYGANGGVTVSGGEPFLQGGGTLALLKACKERGISTAVETCGYADSEILLSAVPYVDLFLWDVKDTDAARHTHYTGVSNERILDNLQRIADARARIRLRCILVQGVNTDDQHYANVAEIASRIRNLEGVELLPYHAYGGAKATFIGAVDNGRADWIPTPSACERARQKIEERGVVVMERA